MVACTTGPMKCQMKEYQYKLVWMLHVNHQIILFDLSRFPRQKIASYWMKMLYDLQLIWFPPCRCLHFFRIRRLQCSHLQWSQCVIIVFITLNIVWSIFWYHYTQLNIAGRDNTVSQLWSNCAPLLMQVTKWNKYVTDCPLTFVLQILSKCTNLTVSTFYLMFFYC